MIGVSGRQVSAAESDKAVVSLLTIWIAASGHKVAEPNHRCSGDSAMGDMGFEDGRFLPELFLREVFLGLSEA